MRFLGQCCTSTATDFLHAAIHNAACAGGFFSPFHDVIAATRGDEPQKMLFPLIRFCYLLWDVHGAMRRKTSPCINKLLWEGNRCLGIGKPLVQWEDVVEASMLVTGELFPLLHCFTMLLSQALARIALKEEWGEGEKLERARAMTQEVSVHFEGAPGDEWLIRLAFVVGELKRYQFGIGRVALVGVEKEEHVVRGWWAMANMA
jgi:hypothetical protein